MNVMLLVSGIFLVIALVSGSGRFETVLQRNAVAEPVARDAKFAGSGSAALVAVTSTAYATSSTVE